MLKKYLFSENDKTKIWDDTYHSRYGRLEIYKDLKFKYYKLYSGSLEKDILLEISKVPLNYSNKKLVSETLDLLNPDNKKPIQFTLDFG